MRKGKKNGGKDSPVEKIVLATAILNLIEALTEIVKKLIE